MRVMCPNKKEGDYCDGHGDCTETHFCDCDEGKALCEANRMMREGPHGDWDDKKRDGDRRRGDRDGERRERGEKDDTMRFDFPERMGYVEVNPNREKAEVKIRDFGKLEIDGRKEEVEMRIDGVMKAEMDGKDEKVRGRVNGMGRFEMEGNRLTITMGASKLVAGASAILGVMSLQ